MSDTTELRNKFRLSPSPAGVRKIAQLVNGRETASLEEIAKVIKSDVSVTGRLMTRAFPRAPAREEATVQMATTRVGINYVIVLFIADLLTKCVVETFETMVSLSLTRDDTAIMPHEESGHLIASVKFKGQATGRVSLAFSSDLSLLVAARLLGDRDDISYNLETISDAIGEIVNIITGNLQSGLCDGGLPCEVELPEVTLQQSFVKETVPGGTSEQFFFRQGTHGLRVNLCVNPFSSS